MSKWKSGSELLTILEIKDFELLDYVKNGLQPHNHLGVPIPIPDVSVKQARLKKLKSELDSPRLHDYRRMKDEVRDGKHSLITAYQWQEATRLTRYDYGRISDEIDILEKELAPLKDIYSWGGYDLPDDEPKGRQVLALLLDAYYIVDHIVELKGNPKETNVEKKVPLLKIGNDNIFRQSGVVWSIQYKGNEAHVKALEGVRHIARLLESKGAPVPVHEMISGKGSEDEEYMDSDQAASNDLPVAGTVRMTAAKQNKILWDEYTRLQEVLQSPDLTLEEKEETEEKVSQCLAAIGKSEEAEKQSNIQRGVDRGRQSTVKRALNRAIDAIAKTDSLKELAQHLKMHIKTDGKYTYRYTGGLPWDIFWQK